MFVHIIITLRNYYSAEYGQKPKQDTNDTKTYGNEPANAETRTLFYFSQLSKQQRSKLYDMYYFDFKLFDYDAEMYGEIDKNNLFT